jgi:glycosyltransferase involved in cell wall biosynthesis
VDALAALSAVKPIRVLDLRDTYEIGGPGKTILETYRFIDRSRFELHLAIFLTPREGTDTPFLVEARKYGIPVHYIHGANQYDPRLIARTAALVQSLDIDLVHAHEVKSDVITWLAARLHRVPIMTTMHGWIGNTLKQRALIRLDKWLVRRFDMVLAVSGRIQQDLLGSGVPAERIRLVHNAIVMDRYERTGKTGMLAALVGRMVPGPVLTCVGRLSAEKGHADFIDALGIVAERGHRVFAVLAGEGVERGRLETRIAALGLTDSVFLPGYVEQPRQVLEETDLLVLPSHTEGLPNVALEALAMAVPVLATRVGGTPEVIEDGVTGRLIPARNPAAMAAAIEDFLAHRDTWKGMALRGHASLEARFDFRVRTRAVEALYTEVVENARR